jgi:hypothetical protein
MSNAATVSDFDRDQQNCESSCPGTDMQIYYDPARGGEPGPMISIRSGMSYASLPTAFQHQDITIPRDPQCGCGIAKNFEVIAGTPAAARLGEPVPTPRLDPASEPDEPDVTVAPAHGGSIVSVDPPERPLAAGPQPTAAPGLRDAPIAPAVSADLDPDRPVRVVGPQFLPDPEAVIDLQDPDRTTAP